MTDTHIYARADARFDGMDTRASRRKVLHHLRAVVAGYRALLLTGDLAMDGSDEAYRFRDRALPAAAVPCFMDRLRPGYRVLDLHADGTLWRVIHRVTLGAQSTAPRK